MQQQSLINISKQIGLSNAVYKISNPSPLIYRVFQNSYFTLVDRTYENKVSQFLNLFILTPKILHADQHLRIEEFIQARNISSEEIKQLEILKKVAVAVAKMNSLIHLNSNTQFKDIFSFNKKAQLFLDGRNEIQREIEIQIKLNLKYTKEQKEEALQIFQNIFKSQFKCKLDSLVYKLEQTEICFCHNDLNHTNILFTENDLYLIDFEFSGVNYRGFEIGNFLAELDWDYDFNQYPFFKYQDTNNHQSNKDVFVQYYLQAYSDFKIALSNQTHKNDIQRYYQNYSLKLNQQFDQFQLQKFQEEVKLGSALSQYFWMIIAGLSFNKEIKLDLVRYLQTRYRLLSNALNQI